MLARGTLWATGLFGQHQLVSGDFSMAGDEWAGWVSVKGTKQTSLRQNEPFIITSFRIFVHGRSVSSNYSCVVNGRIWGPPALAVSISIVFLADG